MTLNSRPEAWDFEPMTVEYLKDAPPRIFDVHVHYPWRNRDAGGFAPEVQAEVLAYTCRRLNIRKVCLLGRPREDGSGWEATLAAQRRFPELVVPLAQVSLDEHGPEVVSELRERGFRGLKITMPDRDYDDEAYFPLYERAEELGLPILFHTGIRGGPIDYLQFPPRDAAHAEAISAEYERTHARSRRSAARMQPIFLDTIALAFPGLRIIGAHLGYGLYDSAAAVARWRRNVSFDISGGKVVRRHIVERRMIKSEVSLEKLVFGSDCDVAHMSREVTAWMEIFDELGLTADEQDKIFYRNAAAIFGET
jgi:predicted TIM-barrel fold metal-dependent hydrolase